MPTNSRKPSTKTAATKTAGKKKPAAMVATKKSRQDVIDSGIPAGMKKRSRKGPGATSTETPLVIGEPVPVKQEPEPAAAVETTGTVAELAREVDNAAKLPEPVRSTKGKKAGKVAGTIIGTVNGAAAIIPDETTREKQNAALAKVVKDLNAAGITATVGKDAPPAAQEPAGAINAPAPEAKAAPVTIASLEAELDAGYAKMDELLAEYEKVTKNVVRLELQIEALTTTPVTK